MFQPVKPGQFSRRECAESLLNIAWTNILSYCHSPTWRNFVHDSFECWFHAISVLMLGEEAFPQHFNDASIKMECRRRFWSREEGCNGRVFIYCSWVQKHRIHRNWRINKLWASSSALWRMAQANFFADRGRRLQRYIVCFLPRRKADSTWTTPLEYHLSRSCCKI